MSLNLTDQMMIGSRMQARLLELKAVDERANQMGPLVDEARRLRHQRHVATLHRMIEQLEATLGKIKDGTYGSCDGCGGEISAPDLRHEPASTVCAACRGHLTE